MGNAILGLLLLAGPQTIYSLRKLFERGVSLFYGASLGGLRSALTGLLRRGEVELEERVENGRGKKYYRPTPAGVAAFHAWLTGPLTGSDVETAALSKVFFLGLLDAAEDRRAVLDDICDRIARDAHRLDRLAVDLDSTRPGAEQRRTVGYQRAVLDYGIGVHRFALDHFTALRDAERPGSRHEA